MDRPISPARLSDLIAAIYDCAVDPGLWPETLGAIRGEMGFATANLSSLALPSGRILLSVSSGIEPAWAERIADYGSDVIELWGGPEVASSFPIGEPGVLSQLNPRASENRYVVEWGLPQGLVDSMAIVLVRDGASVGNVGFGRHVDQGPIGEAEVALGRLLAPHLQRAVTISRLLDAASVATALGAVVDRLAVPIILVGRGRSVLHANQAAQALLQGGVFASSGGRLALLDPAAKQRLDEVLEQCQRDERALTRGASGLPVRDRDGRVHAVHVLPLGQGAIRPGLFGGAVAAVVVSAPGTWAGGVADAVAALFELTPTEARVFRLVAAGSTPAEAARALGVAPSTLKTHLLRVFDKVGLHRQAELVQLAGRLVSPLRQDEARSQPGSVR